MSMVLSYASPDKHKIRLSTHTLIKLVVLAAAFFAWRYWSPQVRGYFTVLAERREQFHRCLAATLPANIAVFDESTPKEPSCLLPPGANPWTRSGIMMRYDRQQA